MTLSIENTMQALWLEDRSLSFRQDLPTPRIETHEALVRVLRAGICNTDLEMLRGYYPFSGIPGHEFVGIVEEGPDPLIGHPVVGEINISCGECAPCQRELSTHCERRQVLGLRGRNGAFADYLTLPADNLHLVPPAVPLEAALFAEPLAAALQIQEQTPIAASDRCLVVGAGKLGQLIAQTLALTGCDLHVVGRRRGQIDVPGSEPLEIALETDILPGSFDTVVECSGNHEGFRVARQAVRPRGTVILKSTYSGQMEIDASALVVDEITLLGSRCGPMASALELLADGRVDVEPLIGARFSLRDGVEAFGQARQSGALKVIFEIADI